MMFCLLVDWGVWQSIVVKMFCLLDGLRNVTLGVVDNDWMLRLKQWFIYLLVEWGVWAVLLRQTSAGVFYSVNWIQYLSPFSHQQETILQIQFSSLNTINIWNWKQELQKISAEIKFAILFSLVQPRLPNRYMYTVIQISNVTNILCKVWQFYPVIVINSGSYLFPGLNNSLGSEN